VDACGAEQGAPCRDGAGHIRAGVEIGDVM
jgi:hypothetical protein